MNDEQNRPTIRGIADLMPKFDPDAVEGLRRNLAAISASMLQYGEGLRNAAPAIMANLAKAMPIPMRATKENP